jgi:hypothetical protein
VKLSDLLEKLDWSQAEEGHEEWIRAHPDTEAIPQGHLDRTNLVIEALQGIVEVPLPGHVVDRRKELFGDYDEKEIRIQARTLLRGAGVWGQILKILEKEGLYAL